MDNGICLNTAEAVDNVIREPMSIARNAGSLNTAEAVDNVINQLMVKK